MQQFDQESETRQVENSQLDVGDEKEDTQVLNSPGGNIKVSPNNVTSHP